jgi:enamine deaminase RidA (YjgF/YER057c/UK114 family)
MTPGGRIATPAARPQSPIIEERVMSTTSTNTIVRHDPMDKLCDAVEYGGLVFLAGQVAEDMNAGMKAQTESVLRQIDTLLAKCGSHKSRILTATVYVADMSLKPQMDEAWLAWADARNLPARATVQAALGSPDTLVEIQCTAAKNG